MTGQGRARTVLTSEFAFRDVVMIDNDPSLTGVVTGFAWSTRDGEQVKVAWIHAGDSKSDWLDTWRLTKR